MKRRDVLKAIGAVAVAAVVPALPSDRVLVIGQTDTTANGLYSARDQFVRSSMMALNRNIDVEIMESLSRELH